MASSAAWAWAPSGHTPSVASVADSQFFIMLTRYPSLDGKYTVWGKVVEGMDYVDKIKKAPPNSRSGTVDEPDSIVRMRMAADVKD